MKPFRIGMVRELILSLAIFSSCSIGGALSASTDEAAYDEAIERALMAEASEDWKGAIEAYLEARKHAPNIPFPAQHIARILRARLQEGEEVDRYRALLPEDLDHRLERDGVYHLEGERVRRDFSKFWNWFIWGGLLLVILAGGAFFLKQFFQKEHQQIAKKGRQKNEQVASTQANQAAETPREEKKETSGGAPVPKKVEAVVTEKTREEMQDMFSSVRSLTGEQKREEAWNEEELDQEAREKLENSGILHSFAEALVSQVKIEESEYGKFSKMSVDASMLFEEGEKVDESDKGTSDETEKDQT